MKLALESCTVDLERRKVVRDGTPENLTVKEAALLGYLAARPGRSVDQHELLRDVWGYASGVVTRTVRTTVSRLRAKIEADPAEPVHLVTVYGEGYRFLLGSDVGASTNLPQEVDRFFGREAALGTLAEAFGAGRRLVTVAGPPGIGKTRLARRYAAGQVAGHSGGVWFCDVSEATTDVGVARVVAGVLGVAMAGAPVDEVGRRPSAGAMPVPTCRLGGHVGGPRRRRRAAGRSRPDARPPARQRALVLGALRRTPGAGAWGRRHRSNAPGGGGAAKDPLVRGTPAGPIARPASRMTLWPATKAVHTVHETGER